MASSINASTAGAGGVITTADNSGVLQVQTAGTTALTISAAQAATFAGTVAITGNTALTNALSVSGDLSFNSGYGSSATAYGCRAWVNFNGVGTVSIRGSGNVSSITDSGVGNYRVNFTTALVDANFSGVASANEPVGQVRVACTTGFVTGYAIVYTFSGGAAPALADVDVLSFGAFR